MSFSISSPDCMLSNLVDNVDSSSSRLEHLYNLRSIPPINQFNVVKMRNIPWDISTLEIVEFFYPLKIPFGHVAPHYCHGIHIPMQSSTGKTISECFVEFENSNDAHTAVKVRKFIKGRLISVVETSQQELMDRLFPGHLNYNESFDLIPGLSIENNETCTWLSQQEINGILLVCKRFKLHYSRKCAERPFELVISVLSKMPWHQTSRISLLQRDHLFEMFKIATESLVLHLAKSAKRYLENTLLNRLVRAGLTVPLFTEKQKLTVLSVSNLNCPKDLESFVFNPPEEESDMSPKSEKVNLLSSPASISSRANVKDLLPKVSIPFQTPIGYPGKIKGNYSSLFETNGSSRFNQGLPSPASSILLDSNESSPWKMVNGKFPPFSSNGSNMKQIMNDQTSKISDLERKLEEYRLKWKSAGEEVSSKHAALSDLNERHLKLRDQLRSCLSFIKSLQRRNDELEYFHFKSEKSSWGLDGLHMEYSSWKDMKF